MALERRVEPLAASIRSKGDCGGKSAICEALATLGQIVIDEAGRRLVREQLATGGDAMFRRDRGTVHVRLGAGRANLAPEQFHQAFDWSIVVFRRTMDGTAMARQLAITIEQEDDGRWIAEIQELPGVMAYGATAADARAKVEALALRVLADRREHGEPVPEIDGLFEAA